MIKGAIFDLDGTVLDSMYVWDGIGVRYLESIGIDAEENLNTILKTFSLEDTANYFKEKYKVLLPKKEIMDAINKMASDCYEKEAPLKPYMKELLKELKERDVRLCIATVTDKHLAEAALERLGVLDYFDDIITCAMVGKNKEEPDIYREALRRIQVKKEEAVVFEDSYFAAKTAKNDGFTVVGVYDKHEKKMSELKELTDFYITNYSKVKEIFL